MKYVSSYKFGTFTKSTGDLLFFSFFFVKYVASQKLSILFGSEKVIQEI